MAAGQRQGGLAEHCRERFGLIYPDSDKKLAGFHAGMWLSVMLILTPWYSERGWKARDLSGGRQGWNPACGPTGLLANLQASVLDRRPGPGQLRGYILLATRWRCCPPRLQKQRGVWEGTGVCVREMRREDEGSSRKAQRLNLVRSLSGVRVLQFGCRSWFSHIPKWSHTSCELLAVQFLTCEKDMLPSPQRVLKE